LPYVYSDSDEDPGIRVLCPTGKGMEGVSKETFSGTMAVRLWRVLPSGGEDVIVDARTTQAAVEVGGAHLGASEPWCGSCEVGVVARAVLSADVPLPRDFLPGL